MALSDVQVIFEIGHRSSVRSKVTHEGFTHDWEVFVRGVDSTDISNFVEKVVFYLHETFPKPKRVLKEPPYSVKESGYAGFNLVIDIYFKNKDEPKKFKYNYDLELQTSGPPINKVLREKFIFPCPSGDFRKKLIRGGGVGVNGNDGLPIEKSLHLDTSSGSSQGSKSASGLGKAKPSADLAKKHKVKEPKAEEFRPTSEFSELFGPPIKTSKVSPDPKKQSPSSSKALINAKPSKPSDKPSSSSEKPSSSDSKTKHSSQKDSKRDKDGSSREEKKEKREKNKDQDKKSAKPLSPVPKPTKEETRRLEEVSKDTIIEGKSEKKKKDKKNRDEKSKKDKHKDYEKPPEKVIEKVKEKENKKSPKPVPSSKEIEKPEKLKDKEKHRDGEKDRSKHKHKKKEKEKNKKSKEDGKDREKSKKDKQEKQEKERAKNGMEESSSVFKAPEPHSPSPPAYTPPSKPIPEKLPAAAQSKEKTTKNPLSTLFEELSDHESSDSNNSPMSGDEDLLEFTYSKSKESKKDEAKKSNKDREAITDKGGPSKSIKQKDNEKRKDKDDVVKEQKRRKRKGSHNNREVDDEPVVKATKQEVPDVNEQEIEPITSPPQLTRPSPSQFSDQYVSELKELQHNIMNLADDEELQRLVSVIAETGQYEMTKKTFDFDLCTLDRTTVKRLQDFFRNL